MLRFQEQVFKMCSGFALGVARDSWWKYNRQICLYVSMGHCGGIAIMTEVSTTKNVVVAFPYFGAKWTIDWVSLQ